ncbi:MAG: N-acetyltransferase family protein [Blastocatellia bacterium]
MSDAEFTIDTMRAYDWEQVREIYVEGITTGDATFETEAPGWDAWNRAHLSFGRLVARNAGPVIGWAALSPVSGRRVYAGVAEVSVYVGEAMRGKGVGRRLLMRLIEESERAGIWTLQAGILPENRASLKLHKGCGFREVGRRERLGKLNGVWRDVVVLERRSATVGTE